jgi:CheY-like chemotaxis protein
MIGKRIMVVDDDLSLRVSMKLLLKHRGYEVSLARDADEVLELATRHKFELILMDICMPGRSGVDVFEELRRRGVDTKVIFISAYALEDDVERALEAGALRVLRKPVDVDHLFHLIDEQCVSRARAVS